MTWTETSSHPTTFGIHWRFDALGRRIVLSMLGVALFFTLSISAVQFAVAYAKADAALAARVEAAWRSHGQALQLAYKNADPEQIEALLDGLNTHVDIAAVWLEVPDGRNLGHPVEPPDFKTLRRFVLPQTDDRAILNVAIDDAAKHAHLENLLVTKLFGNVLSSILIGMAMLLVFDRLAARHLKRIADEVRGADWMNPERAISLTRDDSVFPDETESILEALEAMRKKARSAYASISEQALDVQRLNASLEDAIAEQSDLTRALSHDLITPINTLEMLLREVVSQEEDLPPTAREDMQDMQASVERMRQQIASVQSYAALLEREVEFQRVDLNDCLARVLEDLAEFVMESGADVTCGDLPIASGDPQLIGEMLRHLLHNSLTYRSPSRTLRLIIRAAPGDGAGVVIEDNGLGVDSTYQAQIFGLFRRLHAQSDIPGHGLGLPIARKIAERHKGSLTFTSSPGVGTIVTVSFTGHLT